MSSSAISHPALNRSVLSSYFYAAFRGHSIADWRAMLDQAAGVGLLGGLGAGMYRIHPALPAYLAARWRGDEPDACQAQRADADRALLDAYAAFGGWLLRQIQAGDAGLAHALIHQQRRTLGALLGSALDGGLWGQAQAIAQPLNEYWDTRGLHEEARAWVDRARLVLEDADGTPPPLDTPAGALWLFLASSRAAREVDAHRLDSAERGYRQIVETIERQPESPGQRGRLAVSYHHLGIVAELRQRLDDAEDWYRKSLTIKEELGDRPGMASTYHQLGIVAQIRARLDDAEDWYRRSLTIKEELGNRPGMATTNHQLGMVAEQRGRLDDAEGWYHKIPHHRGGTRQPTRHGD